MIELKKIIALAWDFMIRHRFAQKSVPPTPCWVMLIDGVGQVGSVQQTYHDFMEDTELVGSNDPKLTNTLRRKYPK